MAINERVIFEYCMHPRTAHTLLGHRPPPPKVDDGRVGLNGKIGLLITTLVGTMICGADRRGQVVARPYCAVSGPVTGLVALARKNDL
jgi:hypothetical protein